MGKKEMHHTWKKFNDAGKHLPFVRNFLFCFWEFYVVFLSPSGGFDPHDARNQLPRWKSTFFQISNTYVNICMYIVGYKDWYYCFLEGVGVL